MYCDRGKFQKPIFNRNSNFVAPKPKNFTKWPTRSAYLKKYEIA